MLRILYNHAFWTLLRPVQFDFWSNRFFCSKEFVRIILLKKSLPGAKKLKKNFNGLIIGRPMQKALAFGDRVNG